MLTHCRSAGIPLPDAEVEEMNIAVDDDCSVTLTFDVETPEQQDQVQFGPETVLCALAAFCRLRSIPLPRTATKRLEPLRGALSMVFDVCRTRSSVRTTSLAA